MQFERIQRDVLKWTGLTSLALSAAVVVFAAAPGVDRGRADQPVTITDYTDPGQALAWNTRSHWKQPWRSYLDTVPATTLLDAIGINFNVKESEAAPTARLLAESGFKRARMEISWKTLDYDDPTRFTDAAQGPIEAKLKALRANGIRPLILLNANSGGPCPVKLGTIELTQPASPGATELHIAPSDVSDVAPGRTGIASGGTAAAYLFRSVDPDGTIHLSAPLGELRQSDTSQRVVGSLEAGPLEVETLLYEPFRPAHLEDGSPNPRFEPTMRGWLDYVGVVTREVKSMLGSDQFDVEVWNELSFGSRFLDINGYYKPWIEGKTGDTNKVILARTVEYLRDPAHGVPHVGIGNGFANQAPWWNGTESPVGLTAIDKHPYAGLYEFPREALLNGNRPLDALNDPSGWQDAERRWHDSFTPTYNAFFPEYFLAGLQTETLVNDLAPYFTYEGRAAAHGRYSHPEGGDPPQIWITEVNLNPAGGGMESLAMTAADIRHIESKNVLRYLAAYVNKGVTAIDFYAAKAGNLSLVDPSFFSAVRSARGGYPGTAKGGGTMDSVRRLVQALHGAEPIASPRSLSLDELTDFSSNTQFVGDGTARFRPLYNREVFAFLPFQVTEDRFVIPVYVMTRNVAKNYRPAAPQTDPTRFDLPAERYRLSIGGVDGTEARASATDPLTGHAVPVTVVSRSLGSIVVELDVTDSPRLLEIDEGVPTDDPGETEEPALPPEETPESLGDPETEFEEERPGSKEDEESELSLEIRRPRSLLRSHTLTVVGNCGDTCNPRVSGVLRVAGRAFTMRADYGSARVQSTSRRFALKLSISPKAAARALDALRAGEAVWITVQASDRGSRDSTITVRRVLGS